MLSYTPTFIFDYKKNKKECNNIFVCLSVYFTGLLPEPFMSSVDTVLKLDSQEENRLE